MAEITEEEKLKIFRKAKKFADKHRGPDSKYSKKKGFWQTAWMRCYTRQVKWQAKHLLMRKHLAEIKAKTTTCSDKTLDKHNGL
jgi:hypothetical protein